MESMTLPAGCRPDCPGCAHRHLGAAASEGRKAAWLAERLAPWADVLAPLRAADPADRLGYRERACLAAEWDAGRWAIGLRRRDRVVPIPHCPVHSERVRSTLALLSAALPPGARFPLHYLVQSAAQVTLVLKCADPPAGDWLGEDLWRELQGAGVEGLWLHLFPSVGRRVFAKGGWQRLAGEALSRDEAGLLYGPTAFSQLLPGLYAESVAEAVAFLTPGAGDAVVDLYCGRGRTLREWVTAGAHALGVELGGEAVACAERNVPQARVLRGTCAARLPQVDAWLAGLGAVRRLLYLNPPRTGLEPEVADWITGRGWPARVAYLSCSAGTLARDLERLTAGGYRVARITPYDFFPQTLHVETLALLERG